MADDGGDPDSNFSRKIAFSIIVSPFIALSWPLACWNLVRKSKAHCNRIHFQHHSCYLHPITAIRRTTHVPSFQIQWHMFYPTKKISNSSGDALAPS
ncbi:hypothetical protein SLEP1_g52769 [Rubroshorea leprosula]|uniref:Uncharacterized protein n=1 Tax=Rubroshorea leprosula TaxID=152421 RepID=A0AAV5M7A7_9ROSI|nr:hypothetical protein SLEP1_g52769 [Rubroshorea leprosula]